MISMIQIENRPTPIATPIAPLDFDPDFDTL